MTVEEPPAFRLYPSAYTEGEFQPTTDGCTGCHRQRGWLYTGDVDAGGDTDGLRFCPWCVADGTAAALGVTFNHASTPASDEDELCGRTPGFTPWQSLDWAVHHDRACVYLGAVGYPELASLGPAAVEAMRREIESWGWSDTDVSGLVERLDKEGGPTGYVWRCTECGYLTCAADTW